MNKEIMMLRRPNLIVVVAVVFAFAFLLHLLMQVTKRR